MKSGYGEKVKLFDINTSSFIVHMKTEHIYINITKDFEARYHIQTGHQLKEKLKM